MKKNRYTEEQIAYALKQAELGTAVPEICRKLGIAEQTFYRWRSKYAGMLPSDLKRLKQLEEENGKLKKLVAEYVQWTEDVSPSGQHYSTPAKADANQH